MKILTLIFLLSFNWAFGQIDSATTNKINKYQFGGIYKSSVSFNLAGVTGYAGFTYDYFISDRWRFEVGGGYTGLGFGFDFYPKPIKREKARFKINLRHVLFSPFQHNIMIHALGFGMTKFFRQRFNFGFDVGFSYTHSIYSLEPYSYVSTGNHAWPVYPHANVKVGYRFSFKAMKRKRELERESNEK